MEICLRAAGDSGLTDEEIQKALVAFCGAHPARKVLILPPDYTRYHSKAGFITNVCYHYYAEHGAQVDILPTLGTHRAMTREEAGIMCGDIPFERFFVHNWRTDVEKIGEVPGSFIEEITGGLWAEPVDVEVNRRIMDESYDLILSPGQVVPHEVIGMANHSKNIFVGAGGSDMINQSHMIGAVYGMERMMGRDNTPVRKIFDYALKHFLAGRPIEFLLTVTTAPDGKIHTHGMFAGSERDVLEAAIELAQKKNIDFVDHGIKKCVVYLDPSEFHSTWLGNKAVYRTRMAVADGGELLILAPGVETFGEDAAVDRLIRKYGYCGRKRVLELVKDPGCGDLRANMGAAAHLIHGSSDGRFIVTYAVRETMRKEIESVHFRSADVNGMLKRYDPSRLRYGSNIMEDGEEIFYIPNPALGLWIDRERFEREGGAL